MLRIALTSSCHRKSTPALLQHLAHDLARPFLGQELNRCASELLCHEAGCPHVVKPNYAQKQGACVRMDDDTPYMTDEILNNAALYVRWCNFHCSLNG